MSDSVGLHSHRRALSTWTLVAVSDRLFSTSVTLAYTIPLPPNTPLSIDNLGQIAKEIDFAKIATAVKKDTLEVFATDESASVQVGDPILPRVIC